MKIIVNHSFVDPETVTYGELKASLPSTAGQKIPTAAQLSEEGTVFFAVRDGSTYVTVYDSGFLTYTRPEESSHLRTTVYAVDRCKRIVYRFFCSEEEYEDAWEAPEGCRVACRFEKGNLMKLHILPEATYRDFHWLIPISHICEERLEWNRQRMERKRLAAGGVAESFREPVAADFTEAWIEGEEAERRQRDLELLEKAKEDLTDLQRRTVDLYFCEEGTTLRKVAGVLGTSYQSVHDNLRGALKKMRKFFAENA